MCQILDFNTCRAERLYREGLNHLDRRDIEAAVATLEEAAALNPAHTQARMALVALYRQLGLLEYARAHCEAVLDRAPSPAAHLSLGQILVEEGRYEAALEAFRQCLVLDPLCARARHEMGFVHYLRGHYGEAVEEFHHAAAIEPLWETFYFLGECYRRLCRPREAQQMLRQALALAGTRERVELTRAQLESAARQTEFLGCRPVSWKDRVYCESGVVYLGSAGDDGLNIPFHFSYTFDVYATAVTLRRLLAVAEGCGLRFHAAVPADALSAPVARALEELWASSSPSNGHGQVLVVQALGSDAARLQELAGQHPGSLSFCLAVTWDDPWLPDFVGLSTPLPCAVSWHAGECDSPPDGVPSPQELFPGGRTSQVAARIVDTLRRLPPEPTLDAHVRYYARHHRRLRFWRRVERLERR